MSLIEVLVALALVVLMVFGMLNFSQSAFSVTRHNLNKQFATQKAISMLEELKSLVQVRGDSASVLDSYDDGAYLKAVLTTDRSVTDPAAAVSGNVALGPGRWKYLRQVTVSLLPGTTDPDVRLASVRVAINRDDNRDGEPDALAEVAGVIRTAAGNYPPTQVYDVYAIAVENVPGWWVYMASLIPFVQNAIQNLESRNPGLEFRVHWIRELSYGRDPYYRPRINSSVDSRQPIDSVYFYPGRMPAGSAVDFYYPPDNFRGGITVDGVERNGYDATGNPHPYALADMYNNALRYPDELALFEARVASGQESDDAPPLRTLLERMYANPDAFRNAILINLHGELFPFPPVRNFSDAAKAPADYSGIRVVTHPERLRYPSSATSVRLRVYSYRTDPDIAAPATNRDWLGQSGSALPITVILEGVSWHPTSGSGEIVAVRGGTDQNGDGTPDSYLASAASDTPSATGMYYAAVTSGGDTILSLYNSPVKAPEVPSGLRFQGLAAGSRLYGLEYLPAPAEDFTGAGSVPTPFSLNLSSLHDSSGSDCTGGTCEPNTARWVITVPADVLPGGAGGNGVLRIETSIGAGSALPPNLSTTYLWRGSDTWAFGDGTSANPPHLPLTERFQVLGDPRHNPYADLKMPHQGSGLPGQDMLGMGYNRYFDDFEDSSKNAGGAPFWEGYKYRVSGSWYGVKNDGDSSNDSWANEVEMDANRIFQTLRASLGRPRSVWTTITGFSYYYCGIGGEIGYDSANNFPSSIPVDAKPFTGVSGAIFEQNILPGSGQGLKYVRENVAAPYWWGINWLGELYPDAAYGGGSGWRATGNLPAGVGSGRFVRVSRDAIRHNVPGGTTLQNVGRRTGPPGSTAFFWNGTAQATFHHIFSDGTGALQSGGNEIASRYSYPIPDGIRINRPFGLDVDNASFNPDHFLQAPYGPAQAASYLSLFYDHSSERRAEGSALVALEGAGDDVIFVAVNGISMTGQSGTSFIANWSMLTLIQSFLQAGRHDAANGFADHVPQVPRIAITDPNAGTDLTNPSSVTIGWKRGVAALGRSVLHDELPVRILGIDPAFVRVALQRGQRRQLEVRAGRCGGDAGSATERRASHFHGKLESGA